MILKVRCHNCTTELQLFTISVIVDSALRPVKPQRTAGIIGQNGLGKATIGSLVQLVVQCQSCSVLRAADAALHTKICDIAMMFNHIKIHRIGADSPRNRNRIKFYRATYVPINMNNTWSLSCFEELYKTVGNCQQ